MNGVVDASSTKTEGQRVTMFREAVRASMGSSTLVDEDLQAGQRGVRRGELQWGRRRSSTKTRRTDPLPRLRLQRFNGVVDARRRRPASGRGTPLSVVASMGSSTLVDEDAAQTAPATLPMMLQWGRRRSSTKTSARNAARNAAGVASLGSSTLVDEDRRPLSSSRRWAMSFTGVVDARRRRPRGSARST